MADICVPRGAAAGLQQSPSKPASIGLPAVRWLADLPEQVRPGQTAARFPHIANMLCTRWTTPVACRAYFEELVLDSRGDRQGFPPEIARELAALKDFYESVVYPVQQTAWDELARHSRGSLSR